MAVLHTLKLLLPALIPSWRFFDAVAPSPRIEFSLLAAAQDSTPCWREFRPRPLRLSLGDGLKRMLFNPRWNESLFLVSCAERLIMEFSEHGVQEIATRIEAELTRDPAQAAATPYVQFRLAFLHRTGKELHKHIVFVSPVHRCFRNANP